MTKKFLLNLLINVILIFLVYSGIAAYNSGNMLVFGGSIALLVVFIYLKIVLLKMVNRDVRQKFEEKNSTNSKKFKK